jgi:TetR/AcrR family transcriptional regulator
MNQTKCSVAPPERPRGRPVDTGQQDLKAQILGTAEQLFTDHGYAATSIRNIADTAGVNPALVHYYFGNKHALLEAVLKHSLEPMVRALASLKSSESASVEDIVALLIPMAATHPNIPRLLTREVLLPGGVMQDYFIENLAPQLGGALPGLLERERKAGKLRDDIDPAYAALMILAVCFFPFIARSLAEPVLGIKLGTDGAEILAQNVSELLKRGLTT